MKYTQIKGAVKLIRLANQLKDQNESVQDELTRLKRLKGEEMQLFKDKYTHLIATIENLEYLTNEIMRLEIPEEFKG